MQEIPRVLLAVETSRSYGRGLLRGVFHYSQVRGPWRLLQSPCFYRDNPDTFGNQKMPLFSDITLSYIKRNYFNGIIVRDQKDLSDICKLTIPVIIASYINEDPSGIVCVQSDCADIGKLGAQHFLDRGFRNFAYCGLKDIYWSRLRCESFRSMLEQQGHKVLVYEPPRFKKDRVWAQERNFLIEWLKELPRPVGVFACNDERGRDVIEACMRAGLQVPGDVAVLGVDNDDLVCEMSDIPISSIALNFQKAGYEAAELLDKMMRNQKIVTKRVAVQPRQVVVRRSTDVLAVKDRYVAEAIQYIRQHVREPIQVTDVAEALTLSRRALYEKFQRVLNCSVHQYIKRLRVDEIARLLIESEMNISEIALLMGFGSVDHIAQYFRKHKGMSPSKYRLQFMH